MTGRDTETPGSYIGRALSALFRAPLRRDRSGAVDKFIAANRWAGPVCGTDRPMSNGALTVLVDRGVHELQRLTLRGALVHHVGVFQVHHDVGHNWPPLTALTRWPPLPDAPILHRRVRHPQWPR